VAGVNEPAADRPLMAEYGVPEDLDGILPWSWARERLERSRNYWVVTASRDGRPHAMPVWGLWRPAREEFWFSCAKTSRKMHNLRENPQVTIAADDTVEVVSVEGVAEEVVDESEREQFIAEYVDKYAGDELSRDELATFLRGAGPFVRVVPQRAFGVIERAEEFAPRATRWRWRP
jgi:PPOX class probable F420-dependent enzyme